MAGGWAIRDSRVLLSTSCGVVLLAALVYAVLLLPGVRAPGYNPLIDGWLNGLVRVGVIAGLVVRSRMDQRQRAAWGFFAAAQAVSLVASIAWFVHYQYLDLTPLVSWADAGWLAFYVLLYVGLVLLLRERAPRLSRSLWLDGAAAGLTAAAVAAAALGGTAGPFAGAIRAGLLVFYPIADLILLALSVAAVAILGRATGLVWWLLSGSFMAFAVTDAIYAAQAASGSYIGGSPLDLGWLLARLLLLAAAWASVRRGSEPKQVQSGGVNVLTVPGSCLVLILGLLFFGTRTQMPWLGATLALAAGLAVLVRMLMTFHDVRDLAEARLQARTDELTGLANRRHYYDALTRACARLDRRHVSVVLIDLDHFKEINDGFGHQVGDQVLWMVGERLAPFPTHPNDVLARLGGDQYALLLHDVDEMDARVVAWRAGEALRTPLAVGAATITIDASIGVACAPTHGQNPDELMAMADVAMYAAKDGHLAVAVYDEARDGADLRRLERVAALRDGIRKGQLENHYQPQVDLATGEVVGVEALVRWQHPEEGLLFALEFIPLAESAGLMSELTKSVLEMALWQQRRWHAGGVHLRMSVNVSPSALIEGDFPAQVLQMVSAHGTNPQDLVIELTEELLMDSRQPGVEALARLREAGVLVSIDDYGTGYSSLAYLKDLPATELKLDRTFVADLASSAESLAIVNSTIDLAHALGLEIVAEGVEDPETLEALRAAGCDLVQGYLLSRPVPAEGVPGAVAHAAAQASRRTARS